MNNPTQTQSKPWCICQVESWLRTEPAALGRWAAADRPARLGLWVVAICLGAGCFGAAMGSWRSPVQALYTGIKLPLVILLTTLGNSLLNAMLAPLLGLNVTFRQTSAVILMTFAIMSVILGALSPVALFVVWNTPPLTAATQLASPEYGFMQLTLAVLIAGAGIAGNLHLVPLLSQWAQSSEAATESSSPSFSSSDLPFVSRTRTRTKNPRSRGASWTSAAQSTKTARKVLLAWLAGNLFLGSQICWVLRPFIWDPSGPERFIGREYFHGSFYETVFEAVRRLIFS